MKYLPLLALLALPLAACDSGPEEASARVVVRLTDAPLDNAESAFVTIERVEIGDDETGWTVVDDSPETFDLLTLQNGVTADLDSAIVAGDTYRQIRLIVGEDSEVVYTDGTSRRLKVPSGTQTGIKINIPPILVDEPGETVEIVVDFDAERSFVEAGNSGQVLFKPVLKIDRLVVNGAEVTVPEDDA